MKIGRNDLEAGYKEDAEGANMLYHGTTIQGLKCIKANSTSHSSGGKVAYFTEDRVYALVCCRTADHNFVTLGLREDGKLHYFERFPNQLETLYKNQKGYLYLIEKNEGLINTKGHTWESSDNQHLKSGKYIKEKNL